MAKIDSHFISLVKLGNVKIMDIEEAPKAVRNVEGIFIYPPTLLADIPSSATEVWPPEKR